MLHLIMEVSITTTPPYHASAVESMLHLIMRRGRSPSLVSIETKINNDNTRKSIKINNDNQ